MKEDRPPAREAIAAAIRERSHPYSGPVPDAFAAWFREHYGPALIAVIAYGSRLSGTTASATSIHDFYVVCSGYRAFYGRERALHATLNQVLPPNIYELAFDDAALGRLQCKYCVISLADLERETGSGARDLYHLGRFSKRMGIAHAADAGALGRLVEVFLGATERMAEIAVPRLGPGGGGGGGGGGDGGDGGDGGGDSPFTVERFSKELLGLSYLADRRIESPDKVDKLYASEAAHYAHLHGLLLERFAALGRVGVVATGAGTYECRLPADARRRLVARGERMLKRSRLRGQLRWPKYLLTFENWVDYMLDKIARAKGVEIRLTEAERRHPLLAAARYYWRLSRDRTLE